MSKEKGFSLEINGIEIKSDTLYQVIPKPDLDAPDGFIKWETSKLLMKGIKESAPCHFDDNKRVWDTGFYPTSPCYEGMNREDINTKVEALVSNIVEPYESIMGENILDYRQSNNEFWDNFGGDIYNGKVFNTKDQKDALELYIAILNMHVVRPEDKSKPFASKAKYCIVNKEAAVSLKEQKQYEKAEAIGNFYTLLHNNKELLFNILEYIGVISNRKLDDKTITGIVMEFLEDKKSGSNNIKRFLEAKKQSNTPKGKQEFETFAILTQLRRSRVITEEYGELYLNGTVLGGNLKDATARVIKDKDLKIKVAEAVEKEKQ